MITKFCILTADNRVKDLEILINKHYKPECLDYVTRIGLEDVLCKIDDKEIRETIKDLWMSIEQKIGYEMSLVFNSIRNKNTTLKLKASLSVNLIAKNKNNDIFQSIKKNTGTAIKIIQVDA